MDIKDFVSNFKNHPVLFVGTGISLRYLENSFSWDGLLRKIACELKGNEEYYLDLKAHSRVDGQFRYDIIAEQLESDFNDDLSKDRDGKFKFVNDVFYENMADDIFLSRFKIYIAHLLEELKYRPEMSDELAAFKRIRKNIGSVITTNYDTLVEDIFEFNPLIGNSILLSNPYGSIYKIHGCVTDAERLIITKSDYQAFDSKYELIRAQLLSLFIHNPIVFIGYNVGDENIKSILKTIFSYVEPNSEEAERIRSNFLLVEFQRDCQSTEITEHDIDIHGLYQIRINKVKTDNFSSVFNALSELVLPVSAMDIRKVQSVWKKITTGGEIKVKITEDLENLSNDQMVIAVGSDKTIKYEFLTKREMVANYFDILDEENSQLLETLNKQKVQSSQWFPIFAFSKICPQLDEVDIMKANQIAKIDTFKANISSSCKINHNSIDEILCDENITNSNKENAICYSLLAGQIELDKIEAHLKNSTDKTDTPYRRLVCIYDYIRFG
ncbi:SIR2 family protein [Photobacterium chitinilyticum]|uniref:SIR2 family protein n=1 Tax=Photobacterium chitinilyticum TaxID=2485123 RepID=UPI003D11C2D6